jgi:Ca2+-binding EF-hand superfamily protein
MRRLTEIRQALRAVGKKETEQDVIKRMEEFGSSNLPGMSDIQLEEFSKYIRQFADRRAASQTSGQQAASRAA